MPVGYADGVYLKLTEDSYTFFDRMKKIYHALRELPQKKKDIVFVDNKPCRVIGRIGMNYMEIDVTDVEAKIGSTVLIDTKPTYIQNNIRREYI